MGIRKNLAETLRLYMSENSKTLIEFAGELEIARSSLQQYIKGEGNPSIRMVEQIAEKMEMDPAVLLTGMQALDQQEVAYTLLSTLRVVGTLPKEKQLRFVELFLEMLQLWSDEPPPA